MPGGLRTLFPQGHLVHARSLKFSQEEWDNFKAQYDAVDGTQTYMTSFVAPGIFGQTHHLCEIQNALMYYITDPDEMHDLIKYLTEWELELAEGICSNLHPDAILHHDDWGGERSTFMSSDMLAEFFLDPYMIEMGIDIWQGCMESNNVPELIKKYGGQITFMGDIDNKSMDFDGWIREDCAKAARKAVEECGTKYFIPCITQGGPGSTYPGAYAILAEEN